MRPDIGDLIQGIKRTLTEEILPTVSSDFAREQLAYTLFLCEHLATRWDRAHISTAEEHADLRATLTAAVEIGRRAGAAPPGVHAILDATAVVLAAEEAAGPRPLSVTTASVTDLKRALVRILDACATAEAAAIDACAEIRDTLRGFMKRQLVRDEEWVNTAQIGWW